VTVSALVVNRIAPSFGNGTGDGSDGIAREAVPGMEALEANLTELNARAAREEASFAGLAAQLAPAPVGRIPLFGQDVHELEGLRRAADCLFG
jgi:hypothetical protein